MIESNITLQQLIYLVAVDRRGSFVEAAEECHVSQPALSMQIRKLENTLGVKLFDRGRQPIEPTEIGRRLIRQARMTLREASRVQELVDLAQGEMKGEFRIGATPTLAPWLLPEVLASFRKKHEEITVVVRQLPLEEIVESLKRDRLDAALLPVPLGVETFVEEVVFREELYLYVPRDHRLYEQEVIPHGGVDRRELLLPRDDDGLREHALDLVAERERTQVVSGATGSVRPSGVAWQGADYGGLLRMVENGLGVALLPGLLAEEIRRGPNADMIRSFGDPSPYRRIGVVQAASHSRGHITSALVLEIESDPRVAGLNASESADQES